ncbi:MAG: NAD(P)/FAD-dependent oxidoreductase, partial [Planctomycetota bacterium]
GTVPLDRVRLATPAVSAVVPLPGGGVISREALDAAGVRRAIAAGVAWLPATRVTAILERAAAPGSVSIEMLTGGHDATIETEIAIVAAGLADTVKIEALGIETGVGRPFVATASRLGLGATLAVGAGGPPPGELVMAVSREGYCGVVRLEDGRVDLAAAVDRRAVAAAGSAAAVVARILAETAGDRLAGLILEAPLATATFRGTPPLTRAQAVATPTGRILRVGDAAGYVEPFTGEGMGWALASARLLDQALAPVWMAARGGAGDFAMAAARYARLHAGHFSRHHARCRRIALAVRRPWVVGSAVRLARLAPAVAARVAPLVVGTGSPRKAHG